MIQIIYSRETAAGSVWLQSGFHDERLLSLPTIRSAITAGGRDLTSFVLPFGGFARVHCNAFGNESLIAFSFPLRFRSHVHFLRLPVAPEFISPVRSPPSVRSTNERVLPHTITDGKSFPCPMGEVGREPHHASLIAGSVLRLSQEITDRRCRSNLYSQWEPVNQRPSTCWQHMICPVL